MPPLKATEFRARLYKVLKEVLDKGIPVDVELSGRMVEIRPKVLPGGKLARLVKRGTVYDAEVDLLESPFDAQAWEAKWEEKLGPAKKPSKKRAP